MVVVVPLSILKEYVELARDLTLIVAAIELESISSARAILPDASSDTSMLIIDIGARTTIVSFFNNHQLNFTFNIPVAGNHLTKHLMKNLKLSEAEAERIKQKVGLVHGTQDDVVTLLESVFDPVATKIIEAVEYYHQSHPQAPAQQATLIGGSAQLPGIAEYFTKKLSVQCVRGSVLPKYLKTSIVDHRENEQLLFANAIGLAVGSVNKSASVPEINFLAHSKL
jgi:cell division ATPase FtsA